MTEAKICGVTEVADARSAVDAGAWAIGINFWPQSRRYVTDQRARAIASEIGGAVPVVGVFVNAARQEIERLVESIPIDMVQLHGDEAPAACRGWRVPVIKALRLRDSDSWPTVESFPADFVLVDAYVPGERGGTGERIATELIGVGLRDRLILAGGLDPDNVAEMIRAVGPFAVDVASGVESSPGRKDPEKVKRFIENAHHA